MSVPLPFWARPMPKACQTEQNTYAVDGVFVLRDAVAPDQVGAGACRGGGTCKGGCQHGNQPVGCFACGDLAGKPYQYIKAAGQGNVAALSAVEWLAKQKK